MQECPHRIATRRQEWRKASRGIYEWVYQSFAICVLRVRDILTLLHQIYCKHQQIQKEQLPMFQAYGKNICFDVQKQGHNDVYLHLSPQIILVADIANMLPRIDNINVA